MEIKKFLYGGPGYFNNNVQDPWKKVGRKVSQAGLNVLGWIGNAFNTVLTSGASTDFGQTSPFANLDRKEVAKGREQARLQSKLTVERATPYISPSNHIVAWTLGSFNPKVGARKLEQLGPEALFAGALFDIATFTKGKSAAKGTVKAIDKGLAYAGNKKAKGRVIAREINKYTTPEFNLEVNFLKSPVYVEGRGVLDYPNYVTYLGDKFKNKGARVELPDLNAGLWKEFDKKQFVPVFLMWPGKNLRAHGLEIIRRMEQMGMDVDKVQGHLPLVGDGSIRYLITKNSELPSFIGYYKRPGVAGTYFPETGTTIIDPTRKNNTVYSMQHERNMHGTLRLLTPEMWERYKEFLYKLFPYLGEETTPRGKLLVAYSSDNLSFPINPRSLSEKELRATLGEYRKYLYDNVAYPRAKADGLDVKSWDLDFLRPYFESTVDELTMPDAKIGLRNTNGYGLDYVGGSSNHPKFLEELRWLLKYAPAAGTPLMFKYNEKDK